MKGVKREDVLKWMSHFPAGVTNAQAAAEFDVTTPNMATRMKQYFDKGYITREVGGFTATKATIYRYKLVKDVTPDMPKSERVSKRDNGKTTVRVASDNGEMTELVKRLADGLASQIAAQVIVSLQGQLQNQLAAIIPPKVEVPKLPPLIHPPSVQEEVKQVKRKVLILGLLPQQAGMISEEFGEVFDLHFWKNESHSMLRNMVRNANSVLYMTGVIGHSDIECVESVHGDKPVPINGGMTGLRTALTTLYVNA